MSDPLSVHQVPTSFGVFKPVGWLMVGLPAQAEADALEAALLGAGWPDAELLHFTPQESLAQLEAMADNAGALTGFGYEITLLRRYVDLSREGCRWLLVKAGDAAHAQSAAALARGCGARLAVHYRTLTIEDMI